MNRIHQLFEQKDHDILNIYFTAGFPRLHDTVSIVRALDKAGVDLIEIGMPYSDPLADGPTIQASGTQALKNGMTMELLFEQVAEARRFSDIPMVLMGYFNPVMQYGEEAFFRKCVEVGIDGLILPDLPLYEYEVHYRALMSELGLGFSFLITPQTTEDRIRKVDELSNGFIYMVSNASITGAKRDISASQLDYFRRIQSMKLRNPRLIGFGISSRETFTTACKFANGAIIGSAFIRMLAEESEQDLEQRITQFVHQIRGTKVAVH